MALASAARATAVDGSKTIVLNAEHIAVLNLLFRRLVHIDDAAKRIGEINAGGKRIERRLKSLRPDGLEVEGVRDRDRTADMRRKKGYEAHIGVSVTRLILETMGCPPADALVGLQHS